MSLRRSNIPSGPRASRSTDVNPGIEGEALAGGPIERMAAELAREMRRRWRGGEQPAAEEFLRQHPELWQQPEAAVELIYEEYCLRQATGEDGAEEDILRRFPQWAGQLRVMLECHRCLLESTRNGPIYPEVGECVGEFRLLAELARGARGRVFLAAQTALGDRSVVLKITPLDGFEHDSLARLQHTNIVPLYSVFDDPARRVRVLCMPYFGRTTLASLIQSLSDVPLPERTGRHIVDAIERSKDASSPSSAAASAAKQMLANVSYVQAMSWIAACLADGLQFAHERGLVHLDLKPSNVLLASDGQPMLLDFHLARAPIRPQGSLPENFGGTPCYMPPEQMIAMQSLEKDRRVEVAVDGRADIYALGAMLYEALGGRLPISPDSPPLVQLNPTVSQGMSDIICKCVATRPEDRYPDALSLADDLRRHLTDQPLAGVRNRSVAERWQKWRRRSPSTLRSVAMMLVIGAGTAILLLLLSSSMRNRERQAELALNDGQRQLSTGNFADSVRTLERGVELAKGLPFEGALRRQLADQLTAARQSHLTDQLHRLADEVRVLYGADSIPRGRLESLASSCGAFWAKRDAIIGSLNSRPEPDAIADLQDIAIFIANLQVKRSSGSNLPGARRDALRILDEAEATFGASEVLEQERQVHRSSVALTTQPQSPNASQPSPIRGRTPRSGWEHYALGRAFLASGDIPRAANELAAAQRLDPGGRWANFYYGLCLYRMGRHEEAIASLSVCIGTAPNVAGCFYNRALAYAALGKVEQALRDYDHALRIDPAHGPSALNRGMIRFQQKQFEDAIADLGLALKHGVDPATVHYDLALVHLARQDSPAALDHVSRALAENPAHQQARQLSATLQKAARPDSGQNLLQN